MHNFSLGLVSLYPGIALRLLLSRDSLTMYLETSTCSCHVMNCYSCIRWISSIELQFKKFWNHCSSVWFSPLFTQVGLGETLLDAESIEDQESPVNCFRKLFGKKILMFLFYYTAF